MAAPPVPGLGAACEAAWRVGEGQGRARGGGRENARGRMRNGPAVGGEGSHAVPATSVWTRR